MKLTEQTRRVYAYLSARGGVLQRVREFSDGMMEWWDIPFGSGHYGIVIEYLPATGTLNVYEEVPVSGDEPEIVLSVFFPSEGE